MCRGRNQEQKEDDDGSDRDHDDLRVVGEPIAGREHDALRPSEGHHFEDLEHVFERRRRREGLLV